MSGKAKIFITLTAVLMLVLTVGVQMTPYIVENWVPGQYWSYLPDSVIATTGQRSEFVLAAEAVEVSADELIPVELEAEAPLATAVPPTATAEPTTAPEEAVEAEVAAVEAEPTVVPTQVPTQEPTPTATLPPTPVPLPASYRLPDLDGTHIEAQKFNNCGPTNLSLVLRFYGNEISQLDVASNLKPNNQDRNVSPWQISDYVNEQTNLRSITRSNGTNELIKRLLVAGYPVVIEKGYDPESGNSFGWYGHYLTLFGYDDDAAEYYTLDTFLGPFTAGDVEEGQALEDGRAYSYDYIDFYWQQFNYTFYVVYRPDQEAEVYEILGQNLLNDVAMWQGAALRAQQDIETDDQNAFAWFNLGTALTRLGEITGETEAGYYENGATAFDKARSIGLPSRMLWYQHRPYIAYMKTGRYQDMLDLAESTLTDAGGRNVEETYYYRGHALSLLGDLNGAASSFEKALDLNEYFYPAQIALDYVNSIR